MVPSPWSPHTFPGSHHPCLISSPGKVLPASHGSGLIQASHPHAAMPQPSCRTEHSLFMRCIWAPCISARNAAAPAVRRQRVVEAKSPPGGRQRLGSGHPVQAGSPSGPAEHRVGLGTALDPLCILAYAKQAAENSGECRDGK